MSVPAGGGGRWAAPAALALALVTAMSAMSGCARHVSSRAMGGALDTFKESVGEDAPAGQAPMETIAGRAVDGAVAHLQSPAQIAALRRVVHAAATQAVTSALDAAARPVMGTGGGRVELLAESTATAVRTSLSEGLVSDLGSQGHGPLAASLSATAHHAAAAATDGALARLLPGCTAQDPECLDRRVAELSHDAAAGFMRGVREAIETTALILAFVAGLGCATIAALAIALLRRRRQDEAAG
jgi:hypothetical protein